MDFGLAFSYVFKDRDWLKKISILALVSLIPILGQIVVYGWMMNIAKRVMNHDPAPFQTWISAMISHAGSWDLSSQSYMHSLC